MATQPASIPLQAMEMSGLPHAELVYAMAATKPKQADSRVFTATIEIRRSVAPKVEPGLKPIHPNSSTMVPITT